MDSKNHGKIPELLYTTLVLSDVTALESGVLFMCMLCGDGKRHKLDDCPNMGGEIDED